MRCGHKLNCFLAIFLLIFSAVGTVGCAGSGTSAGGGSGNLTVHSYPLSTVLPPGFPIAASALSIQTSIETSALGGNGSGSVKIFDQGPQMAKIVKADGTPVLLGWAGPSGNQMNAHTTAEVMLYFDLYAYLLPSIGRVEIVSQLKTKPEVQQVADAITTALATDSDALVNGNALIRAARAAATSSLQPRFAIHPHSVTVNPTDSKSGISVKIDGLNAVILRNDFRRRAYAYVDRVSYVPEGSQTNEAIDSPAAVKEMDISPTTGVTSLFGTFADIIAGNMAYTGVDSDSISLPPLPNAKITNYRVRVVGPGAGEGDLAKLTTEQNAKRKIVTAKAFLIDFAIPLIANSILPLKGDSIDSFLNMGHASDILEDTVTTVFATAPNAFDKVLDGHLKEALVDIFNNLASGGSLRAVVFECLFKLMENMGSNVTYQTLAEFTKRGEWMLKALDVVESALTLADSTIQVAQFTMSDRADEWNLAISKSKVQLTPVMGDIKSDEQIKFTANVPAATGPGNLPIEYEWKVLNHKGGMSDGSHSGESFTTNTNNVTYIPYAGVTAQGDVEDTIQVTAKEIDGQNRNPIGTETSKIKIRKNVPHLYPLRVSLHKDESQTFTASLDEVPTGTVRYRWKTTGKFGRFAQAATEYESSSPTAQYIATTSANGEDTVSVKVLSVGGNGTTEHGTARSQAKIEEKKTIVIGHFDTQVNPKPDDRVNVNAIFTWPKVEGAKGYSVHCYGFNDTAYYGKDAYFGPFGVPPNPGEVEDHGSFYLHGLAGITGPSSIEADAVAYYRARFAGMIVEVTVTY